MSKNPLKLIPTSTLFDIPIIFKDRSRAYIGELRTKFASIMNYLRSCNDDDYTPSIKSIILGRVEGIQNCIIEIITEYLEGHPSTAYDLFSELCKKYDLEQELFSIQQTQIPAGTYFFRTQKDYNKPFLCEGMLDMKTPFDLFHPPFQLRRSIGTNRFSISGYPSLYISKNLHTSYSECYPGNHNGIFHSIAFKNVRPLYFVDFSKEKLLGNKILWDGLQSRAERGSEEDISGIIEYLGIYQLIIASHTKVDYKPFYKDEVYHFKIEYIIPQIMLQWIKINGLAVDGIRYKSCTGNKKFPGEEHYNYVIPVRNGSQRGYCPSVTALFQSSPVYSYGFDNVPEISDKLSTISSILTSSNFKNLI